MQRHGSYVNKFLSAAFALLNFAQLGLKPTSRLAPHNCTAASCEQSGLKFVCPQVVVCKWRFPSLRDAVVYSHGRMFMSVVAHDAECSLGVATM
jgi:hypothetical protein